MIKIDGVRVRADEARQRGIHPDQIVEREAAAVAAAEKAEQDRVDQEAADKADFDARVQAAAEKLVEERDAEAAKTAEASKTPAAKVAEPKNK